MYQRFIQMLIDDQVKDLPKEPADELDLHHMKSENLSRLININVTTRVSDFHFRI
ncbi:hypothetical protein Hanom_Chr06g00539581 [Helianthus anomalus]